MQTAKGSAPLLATSSQGECSWPQFPNKHPIKVLVLQRKQKPGVLLLPAFEHSGSHWWWVWRGEKGISRALKQLLPVIHKSAPAQNPGLDQNCQQISIKELLQLPSLWRGFLRCSPRLDSEDPELKVSTALHRRAHSSSEVISASPKILQQGDLQLCTVSQEQVPFVRFLSKKIIHNISFSPPLTTLFSLLPRDHGDFYYFTLCLGKAETSPCTPSNQENPKSEGDQISSSTNRISCGLEQHNLHRLFQGG